jgi:hypothetical protein
MSASPFAVAAWIALMVFLSRSGVTVTTPTVLLLMFLAFAPLWLLGEYLVDIVRFRRRSE